MIQRVRKWLLRWVGRKPKRSRSHYLPGIVYDDDVFLVSYPKSGNTWLRFLIGNYLTGGACDFITVQSIVSDIHMGSESCNGLQRPRFIKSHMPFVPEYGKVVYLVRDGRDVAVSFYFHSLKHGHISENTEFEEFLMSFNEDFACRLFGLWADHVVSWLDNATDNFLLVKFKDLKQDTHRELTRVLDFAGLLIDQDEIADAVRASEFDRMRRLEKSQHALYERFSTTNPDIPFIRSGQDGQWRQFFNDEMLARFVEVHGIGLRRLGYLA